MSITASIWFFVYVGVFTMTSLFSLMLIVPLMGVSFVCAGLIILIGMFSNVVFQCAQKIYEWNITILQSLLVKLADRIPPAHQSPEDNNSLEQERKKKIGGLQSIVWVKTRLIHVSEKIKSKMSYCIRTCVGCFTSASSFLCSKDNPVTPKPST